MATSSSHGFENAQGLNNLQDHERLIQALYTPGADVARIQDVLQRYQRSYHGWAFADELFKSQDPQVRFFGALTFIVKINNDWDTLREGDADSLLERLLQWLLRLVKQGDGPLVLRKLCSALVAYVLRPSVTWDCYVKQLICSFSQDAVVSQQALASHQAVHEALGNLNKLQVKIVLWFSETFIQEVSKISPHDPNTVVFYKKAIANIDDTLVLVQSLLQKASHDTEMAGEAIKCFQAWVNHEHGVYIRMEPGVRDFLDTLTKLKALIPDVIPCLVIQELFDVCVNFFADILTNFSEFFNAQHLATLADLFASPWAHQWLSALKAGGFGEDAQDYSRLLFAYGEAAVQELAHNVHNQSQARVLDQLLELLDCAGYDGAEIQISSQALEFWQTYTEHVSDQKFLAGQREGEADPLVESAVSHIAHALQAGWARIRFPPQDILDSWDSETRTDFGNLRRDLQDLVQASVSFVGGHSVSSDFATTVVDAVRTEAWSDVEAALFCLNGLSDSFANDSLDDEDLSKIFASPLFSESLSERNRMPEHTRLTILTMITNYTYYFERHREYLSSIFRYLFNCLNDDKIAVAAAKAIFSICSSCRKLLVDEVNGFLGVYNDSLQASTAYVKEKIIGGIATVIQAIAEEDKKIEPLSTLLRFVEKDAADIHVANQSGRPDDGATSGLCALRCLASIGRAVQAPDEAIIDLESDPNMHRLQWGVWNTAPALDLQTRVIRLLHECTTLLSNHSDVIEAACQVLRAGYKESSPGLFVLPPGVTVDLLASGCKLGFDSPRLNYLLDAAATMLCRPQYGPAVTMHDAAIEITRLMLAIIRALDSTQNYDPEISASCIELAARMVPTYIVPLFNLQTLFDLPSLFVFILRSLTMPEVMPKRAAAYFWGLFIQLHQIPLQAETVVRTYQLEYGPQLCHVLIRNISGEAARSDLDTLAEPLKKLVSGQMMAKQWLHDALFSPSFTSQKVADVDKNIWLQKIMLLRGNPQTNSVVKEFWVACRGTSLVFTT